MACICSKELGWSNDLLSAIVGTANRIKIMNGIALIEFSNGLNGVKIDPNLLVIVIVQM